MIYYQPRATKGQIKQEAQPMSHRNSLQDVLQNIDPVLSSETYVYVGLADHSLLKVLGFDPLAFYKEAEGITLILRKEEADNNFLKYEGEYCKITLNVPFKPISTGLTAIISSALAKAGIGIKPVHTIYNSYVLINKPDAHIALEIITALQRKIQGINAH
ncbi:hypothetical protein DC083_04675 [Ignatzschineria ureiclastica]|uniref:DUF2241 domain-containing protein n=2 Tax=Ignatzschineria ureiclastica TaxID=472582 RepID=A0A2U2AEU8_9GAMM|nr:hypothetical protein DC083_04675 [Ignatzschineria ureiclastica]GGZ96982.1 transporter [Ignatzschineria ureiclastica]